MERSTGLRERKKDETRRAISRAALDLAASRGPADVTVDDIAAAANVSARTVFNYFPTKEAAILGVDPDRAFELADRLTARPIEEAPVVALREAFREFFTHEVAVIWRTRARLARDHPQLHSAYVARFSSFEDDLTAAVAHRTGLDPVSNLYPRLLVGVAGTALRVAVDHAIGHLPPEDLDRIIDDAFDALTSGLAPPTDDPPRGSPSGLPGGPAPTSG